MENTYLMLNSDTLEIYELDNSTFHELRNYISNGKKMSDELVEQLKNAGIYLESEIYFNEITEKELIINHKSDINSIVLGITNTCNMKCEYCYGEGGNYGRNNRIMKYSTAIRAIDYLISNTKSKDIYVCFFGGEPLIGYDLMEKIVLYCNKIAEVSNIKFHYSITTNATLINDKMASFFKANNISILISIDGDKVVHDSYRLLNDHSPSHDKVISGINILKKHNVRFSTRATICNPNLDLYDIFKYEKSLGANNVVLSLVSVQKDSSLYVGKIYHEKIINEYQKIANDYYAAIANGDYGAKNIFRKTIGVFYYKKMRINPCGAGTNMVAINYEGNIFPCQRFMGDDNYIIGNINDGFVEGLREKFTCYNVMRTCCCECWAKHLCAGSCRHTRMTSNDSTETVNENCDIILKIYEIAIHLYWRLKQLDSKIFEIIFFGL